MSRIRKAFRLDESKGDMTSMIDVVFLLLIFFMVMPFRTPEGRIQSHLPKTSGNAQKPDKEDIEKIEIKIKRNGQAINSSTYQGIDIKLNGRKIAFIELQGHLQNLKSNLKINLEKVPVELNADEDVPFVFVMNALDSAKLTGFTFIKFPEVPTNKSGKRRRHY